MLSGGGIPGMTAAPAEENEQEENADEEYSRSVRSNVNTETTVNSIMHTAITTTIQTRMFLTMVNAFFMFLLLYRFLLKQAAGIVFRLYRVCIQIKGQILVLSAVRRMFRIRKNDGQFLPLVLL